MARRGSVAPGRLVEMEYANGDLLSVAPNLIESTVFSAHLFDFCFVLGGLVYAYFAIVAHNDPTATLHEIRIEPSLFHRRFISSGYGTIQVACHAFQLNRRVIYDKAPRLNLHESVKNIL